jgi:thiol-disulfide isomerase/thioredoxin
MRIAGCIVGLFVLAGLVCAQALNTETPDTGKPDAAKAELGQLLGESANSPIDLIHSLEKFLVKYPETSDRAWIYQTLTKAAVELNDRERILRYGPKVLEDPASELQLLDRVIRELISKGDEESAKTALGYTARYEKSIQDLRGRAPAQHLSAAEWSQRMDQGAARVLALKAHATGNAGRKEEALELALEGWNLWPSGEGAREAAGWLVKLGRNKQAIEFYANAFSLEDPATNAADRARDRVRAGELYTKAYGSEKGVGDVLLDAYDRTAGLMKARRDELKTQDPNAEAADVGGFTLSSMTGDEALPLASLKGKTVVIDLWATWCVPCRAQHPMIEHVKEKYRDASDVVFLSVDADDDQSLVKPFLKEQGWTGPVWFESGLQRKLNVGSIPTLIVLDPAGQVSSRIVGIIPERFEDMLAQRIDEARGKK